MYQSQLNQGPFSKWKFRFTPIETTVKNHFDQKVLTASRQIVETLTSLGNDFRVHHNSKIVNSKEFTNGSCELIRHKETDTLFLFLTMTFAFLWQECSDKNLHETLGDVLNHSNCLSEKRLNLVRSCKSKTL